MCRHLAYLGPPRPLSDFLYAPAHGLVHQSWAPRDMRSGGTINADGFGVGWYPQVEPSDAVDRGGPIRYRQAGPIWSDVTLPDLARAVVAGAVLAAVRSATVGMPVQATAAAPFMDGLWLFSHNGVVLGWPGSVLGLAETLPMSDLLTLEAPTDAALVWALVRHRLRAGASASTALTETVRQVLRLAPGSRLNLLLTDGRSVLATTVGHALSWRDTGGEVWVASEPLDDDPSWRSVPDGRLLSATLSCTRITHLEAS